ncbi:MULTISPECIES: DNA methyltransferase [unclassified Sphaerospermopsis]|uniref:class I SAM-dependent DNA methyltransferase n=1 Tax=unclassified Sphaerospermopsis TaxID=2646443 RepID=UPI00164D5D03|nr:MULTISPECIES: DNA methyltransferase [unclassified Sphaerospermopsis]MBC5795054.1 class I SAM-dependent DNA methyltransferase [Sphaerospermopsis sp. LEGE 00249]MBD2144538.1 class I SAM-dependent DNA methyltransferase [Sphaerospermopsis sp. FACHB-1194]
MEDTRNKIISFVEYARQLKGDEKGEAQVFCDRLFQAFNHQGYKEAGAELEYRVKVKGKSTKFADLLWRPRLLMEMKKRGEKLERHYQQAFEYWLELVPHRPQYVILCNFDEFWIYDFDIQLQEPLDKVTLEDLQNRYTVLNFLFPENRKPLFNNNLVDVTRKAADNVAQVFNRLVERREKKDIAQKFILQCVVALFAEDIDLLPRGLFSEFLDDCRTNKISSYDLIGGLFNQMGSDRPAPQDSRYRNVPYFNAGLFSKVEPIALTRGELDLLASAASEKWSKVEPAIFGTLFESSMGKEERHALGAHYTSPADIQKVVLPTIVRPWQQRIDAANKLNELLALRQELINFKVLDPACGSGNFLYVAYREIKRLEASLLNKIHDNFSLRTTSSIGTISLVKTNQFYGLDIKPFAVELAKVTLMIAKKLALDEENQLLNVAQTSLSLEMDRALPLDNLDQNIRCDDALFCDWVKANAIIGNPPYQSKNKMQQEYGEDYVSQLREKYPEVPGRADYCVYWFRRTHDELSTGGRAGLVGTNTIRQNYSREGGLDYIVNNGGTITEAVSTQVWSGSAVVHVSIVNWIKGEESGQKKLYTQVGDDVDSPWEVVELEKINSSLSAKLDVTQAKKLLVNINSGACYQGQTHGHKGFLLTAQQAKIIAKDESSQSVIHPYLIGNSLLGNYKSLTSRYCIDMNHCQDSVSAMKHSLAFEHIQKNVFPTIEKNANDERKQTGKENGPRQSHFRHWWRFWRGRPEMLEKISLIPRYVACARVTKRPIFEFVSSSIHPNDALQVFPLSDDYSFGILQSDIHWQWFNERCSTLKRDFRYTSDTVFDSFPFPQNPKLSQVKKVAAAAVKLRELRQQIMTENKWSLRELYRTLEIPGKNRLRTAHEELDKAVREAYGMEKTKDVLKFLLELNFEVADREAKNLPVIAPGLPPCVTDASEFITDDCVKMPD